MNLICVSLSSPLSLYQSQSPSLHSSISLLPIVVFANHRFQKINDRKLPTHQPQSHSHFTHDSFSLLHPIFACTFFFLHKIIIYFWSINTYNIKCRPLLFVIFWIDAPFVSRVNKNAFLIPNLGLPHVTNHPTFSFFFLFSQFLNFKSPPSLAICLSSCAQPPSPPLTHSVLIVYQQGIQ